MLLALVALVGVALTTSWWALPALLYAVPGARAARVVTSGARGPGLIPVLQLTGVSELLYGLGLLVGLAIGG
jgi:1,4-dihydroxy-2-naphthoate octaprenyltransferase